MRLDRSVLVSELEKLIMEDGRRGMATDSTDCSVGIMEVMIRIKKSLDCERSVQINLALMFYLMI